MTTDTVGEIAIPNIETTNALQAFTPDRWKDLNNDELGSTAMTILSAKG